MRIDLDAKRAERAKTNGNEPHVLVVGGEEFPLPPELPAEFMFTMTEGRTREAVAVLLGDRYEAFACQRCSVQDVGELVDGIWALYGVADRGAVT